MGTERTSRTATTGPVTAHIGHGLGTVTRTSRGLDTDHPRMGSSGRGGHAETSAWTSNGRADLEAKVRARAWNETSPAIKRVWLNLPEPYGRPNREPWRKCTGCDCSCSICSL